MYHIDQDLREVLSPLRLFVQGTAPPLEWLTNPTQPDRLLKPLVEKLTTD